MFTLTIKTDNAAFADLETEVARILRDAARRIEGGETDGKLRDANGNTVGRFDLEPREIDVECEECGGEIGEYTETHARSCSLA